MQEVFSARARKPLPGNEKRLSCPIRLEQSPTLERPSAAEPVLSLSKGRLRSSRRSSAESSAKAGQRVALANPSDLTGLTPVTAPEPPVCPFPSLPSPLPSAGEGDSRGSASGVRALARLRISRRSSAAVLHWTTECFNDLSPVTPSSIAKADAANLLCECKGVSHSAPPGQLLIWRSNQSAASLRTYHRLSRGVHPVSGRTLLPGQRGPSAEYLRT